MVRLYRFFREPVGAVRITQNYYGLLCTMLHERIAGFAVVVFRASVSDFHASELTLPCSLGGFQALR